MRHCSRGFEEEDVWFLKPMESDQPNKAFDKRILLIGICPRCNQEVVQLFQRRAFDNKLFNNTEVGYKAEKIKEREKKMISYTQSELGFQTRRGVVQGGSVGLRG